MKNNSNIQLLINTWLDFKRKINKMNIPLQEWINKNIPKNELLWKDAALRQCMFVRDRLLYAFIGCFASTNISFKDKNLSWSVVSQHTSKSITLPVYKIEIYGVTFILRDNFHNWMVSVESNNPVVIPKGFEFGDTTEQIHSCYCEGFAKEWVYQPYSENNKKFTIEIHSDYELYCFFKVVGVSTISQIN